MSACVGLPKHGSQKMVLVVLLWIGATDLTVEEARCVTQTDNNPTFHIKKKMFAFPFHTFAVTHCQRI